MVKKNDQLVDGTTSEDVNNLLHVNIIAAIDLFAMSMRKWIGSPNEQLCNSTIFALGLLVYMDIGHTLEC